MTTVITTDTSNQVENLPESMVNHLAAWDWVALILPGLILSPLLNLQCIFLSEREHMQFFPLAFAAVGYFFYCEGSPNAMILTGEYRRWFSMMVLVMAIGVGIFGLFVISPLMAQISFVLCIFAWAVGRFGNLTILRVIGICGLIAVTIPPPFGLDKSMVTGLQSLSSTICSRIMDVTGILHLQRGNVMEIPSKPLFVEEACSGVDSQYALMAVAGTLLLLARTGFVISFITIVTVPIWAILGNLLRIYSIVIGLEFLNIDLAVGMKHTILGLFSFAGAAYAHWSSVQFLNFLHYKYWPHTLDKSTDGANEVSSSLSEEQVSTKVTDSQPSILNSKWLFALPAVLVLFAPMGMWGLYSHFLIQLPSISQPIADAMPGERDLPRSLAGLSRIGFGSSSRHERNALGQHSHTWTYSSPLGPTTVSLDFPFRGFHPLWECYTNAGWQRISVQELNSPNTDSAPWQMYEVMLQNKEGEFGCLHFGFFNELGKTYRYEGEIDVVQPNRAAVNFWEAMTKPIRNLDTPLLFQVQTFCKSEEPISQEQIALQRSLFQNMRPLLLSRSISVFQSLKKPSN